MNIRGWWLCYRHCHVTDDAIRCCTRPRCRGRRELRVLAYDDLMAHLLAVPFVSPMLWGGGNAPEPALMSCEAGTGSGAPTPIAV